MTAASPPPGDFSDRCVGCGGWLDETRATGRPQPEDHLPGCKVFCIAVQVMRYAGELEQAASAATDQGKSDKERRRYLKRCSESLSAAARDADPVRALDRLATGYEAESKKSTKHAEIAELMSQACLTLVRGEDPGPIPPAPELRTRRCLR